jgi:hypothetical protein
MEDRRMKKRTLCYLLVPALIGSGSYFAVTGQLRRAWSWGVKSDPLIEYPARLDLGKHEIGEVAVAHFIIANRGGAELVVDEIHSNCSCTGMEREQDGHYGRVESLRLKAGEQADLVMRVSVRGVPIGAEMINVVEFQTNDPTQPVGRIEALVHSVSGGVSATPQSLVFGTVPLGTSIRPIVDVHDNALTPRTIERVTSTNPDRVSVRLRPDPGSVPSPGADPARIVIGRIEVVVDTATAGDVDEKIQIHLTGEARKPDAITILGKIAAPLEVSPSFLALPRASTKGPIFEGMCVCRSTIGQPVAVTVDSAPPGLTVEVLDEGKEARRVRIRWDPKKSNGAAAGPRAVIHLRAKSGEHEAILGLQILLRT